MFKTLCYPFDSELILKKRKSIKRQLLEYWGGYNTDLETYRYLRWFHHS